MSKAYSDSIALAAREIVAASGMDITQHVPTLPLAKLLQEQTGCSRDTAKRHIRRALGITTSPTWGGHRTPAGGRPRK